MSDKDTPDNLQVMKQGDLFMSGCEALVNAVNCRGEMGAGLAAAFRSRFDAMYKDYRAYCLQQKLKLGTLHTYKNPETNPEVAKYVWIVNFPTMHYPGEIALKKDIESGLAALGEFVVKNKVKSIAIPALGCGIGRFSWAEFLPLIKDWASKHPTVNVKVYEPL